MTWESWNGNFTRPGEQFQLREHVTKVSHGSWQCRGCFGHSQDNRWKREVLAIVTRQESGRDFMGSISCPEKAAVSPDVGDNRVILAVDPHGWGEALLMACRHGSEVRGETGLTAWHPSCINQSAWERQLAFSVCPWDNREELQM